MSDLLQALSRLAGNRHSDGTSSIVSQEDRTTIINGCHDLMISARQPAPVDHVLGSQALLDVAAERKRQVEVEGWTPKHDDQYADGILSAAGVAYALTETERQIRAHNGFQFWRIMWPFGKEWFKPTDRRRDLVKAATLIIAEIERLDRATTTEDNGDGK